MIPPQTPPTSSPTVHTHTHTHTHDDPTTPTPSNPSFPQKIIQQESSKPRSMLQELDPNPSLRPSAPMDSLKSSEPTIPPTSFRENREHRLEPPMLDRLYGALRKNANGKNNKNISPGVEVVDEDEDPPEVHEFGEEGFRRHATVFNGVVRSGACALVRPRCARQVSRLILFCRENDLDLSIKAGGYGTHGWSVAGQIVLDLSLMDSVKTALPPLLDPSWRSLREINWPRRRVQGGGSVGESTGRSGSAGSSDGASGSGSRSGLDDRWASTRSGKGKGKDREGLAGREARGMFYAGGGKRTLDDAYEDDMAGMERQAGYAGGTTVSSSSTLGSRRPPVGEVRGSSFNSDSRSGSGSGSGSGTGSGAVTPRKRSVQEDGFGMGTMSMDPTTMSVSMQMAHNDNAIAEWRRESAGSNASNVSNASATGAGTIPVASGTANMVDGKLDEASKKSLMDALAGPTEYNPDSSAAVQPEWASRGSASGPAQGSSSVWSSTSASQGYAASPFKFPIATLPGPSLSFGAQTAEIPYGMGDRRWQFGQGLTISPDGMNASNNPFNMQQQQAQPFPRPPRQSISSTSSSNSMAGTPNHPPYTLVTFDAGARAKDIDRVTHVSPFGAYHVPLAAFPVGSAVMMSGGFGFLSRLHGLSMDNLTEVEFVMADGRIVWLGRESLEEGDGNEVGKCYGVEMPDGSKGDMSQEEAEELWWAIRGAGTTLGVATRYRAKAYHVPVVFAGNLIFPFNPLTSPSLIQHVRDCIKGAPRNLYCNIILTAGPVALAGVVIIQMCYIGTQAQGAEYLSAIASWNEERCLFKDVRERSFIEQQDSIANILKGGAGRKWFIKSDLVDSLSDETIWKTCQLFHTVPDGCTWLFELSGGALTDCKTTCLPASHRESAYTIVALHQWPVDVPKEDVKCVTTAIDWIDNIIHPASPGGPLPCFLQSSHPDAVKGTYGENFERLVSIKNKYDPSNFFKHTVWPTGKSERETGNPLMTYAHGSGCSSQQQQIYAEEDSKIGMEGVEAIAQIARQRSSTPGQNMIIDDAQGQRPQAEELGMADQTEIARHPEQSEGRDGAQIMQQSATS